MIPVSPAPLALVFGLVAGVGGGDWLSWRGPQQDGTSAETGLPEVVDAEAAAWTFDLRGRGTPVVAGGRVYVFGYEGEGADLQEVLVCLDERDGRPLWERRFSDFLSDVIYDRYSIGAPAVDPESGDVYLFTSAGLVSCFSAEGELRWQHSLMSEFGRMTFPNGRIGAPLIAEDKVVVHFISSCWGPQGPARDRFFAFDKATGEVAWSSTPGVGPKDSSFTFPVLAERGGRLVLYAGTGCGNIVCVDARTGAPVWRYQASIGGVNSNVVVHGERLIAIHGKENVDSSTIGRMFCLPLDLPEGAGGAPAVMDPADEVWRNDLVAFSSSPTLVGDRIYQTVATGHLCCVDADSGEVLWREHLGPEQIHASPVYGDGKLYVPMNDGSFHVLRPTDEGPQRLSVTQLDGACLGAPAIANGRVYVHTTERLYCFGDLAERADAVARPSRAEPGPMVALQLQPADVLLRPGAIIPMRVFGIDALGRRVAELSEVTWDKGALPVSLHLPGKRYDTLGRLAVNPEAAGAVGLVKAMAGDLTGSARVRIVPDAGYGYGYDFEDVALAPHPKHEDVAFAHPPSYWLGAKLKWEVREVEGEKVLVKTLDNSLFQRAISTFGHPQMSHYTVQADIKTDGNRRSMSTAGLINQRYLIQLKGNHQAIEVSSNMERIKQSVAFRWKPGDWYTLKTRVDLAEDGSGVVRAKAWPRDEAEPEAWNIEVSHAAAHRSGAPGLFGFAPQSRFHVYVDNLSVTPND